MRKTPVNNATACLCSLSGEVVLKLEIQVHTGELPDGPLGVALLNAEHAVTCTARVRLLSEALRLDHHKAGAPDVVRREVRQVERLGGCQPTREHHIRVRVH